jgi:hypothetical protein
VSVYVDKGRNWFGRMLMAHMVADTPDELHAMADAVGLQRRWFQSFASAPHYDLCQAKRAEAIQLGAKICGRHEFITHVRRIKRTWKRENGRWKP